MLPLLHPIALRNHPPPQPRSHSARFPVLEQPCVRASSSHPPHTPPPSSTARNTASRRPPACSSPPQPRPRAAPPRPRRLGPASCRSGPAPRPSPPRSTLAPSPPSLRRRRPSWPSTVLLGYRLTESLVFKDLSDNILIGEVPDFLAQLPSVSILDLTGNKLNGSVPESLPKRSQEGSLTLRHSILSPSLLFPSIVENSIMIETFAMLHQAEVRAMG